MYINQPKLYCYLFYNMVVFLQLKLPGADPAQAVAYSMFLRVPPPEDRKDYSRHLYQTLNCSDNLINSSMSYSFRIKLFLNELEL